MSWFKQMMTPWTIVIVILPIMIYSKAETDQRYSLPRLYIKGNHYQFGYQMGHVFAERIHLAFNESETLHRTLLPFYKTKHGRTLYNNFLATANATYRQYVQEVEGIADGANIPFYHVFLMHIQDEIKIVQKDATKITPSCTDVHVKNSNQTLLGHNEDADPTVRKYAYTIDARITSDNNTLKEKFTAFTYPGMIPGNAFAFNSGGLILSCNAVFPKQTNRSALPRNFLTRALLASKGINNALNIIKKNPIAVGVSLNMGEVSSQTLINIELSSFHGDAMVLVSGHYYHFNMFKNFDPPQYKDPSSIHRLARTKMLPVPENKKGILLILGDTKDTEYPIYRNANPPDKASTAATGLFDLKKKLLSIFINNPKLYPQPLMQIPLN